MAATPCPPPCGVIPGSWQSGSQPLNTEDPLSHSPHLPLRVPLGCPFCAGGLLHILGTEWGEMFCVLVGVPFELPCLPTSPGLGAQPRCPRTPEWVAEAPGLLWGDQGLPSPSEITALEQPREEPSSSHIPACLPATVSGGGAHCPTLFLAAERAGQCACCHWGLQRVLSGWSC